MFTHVRKFLSGNSPLRCWPQLFQLKNSLRLKNILHIAETCIVVPLSNTESEQVFWYLWRQLSKEWISLNHQTLETILQLWSAGKDYHTETYDHAIDLFLTEFPNDTIRKRPCHTGGHNYSKKWNVNEKEQNESTSTSNETPPSVFDLSLPSNSKFSESEDKM